MSFSEQAGWMTALAIMPKLRRDRKFTLAADRIRFRSRIQHSHRRQQQRKPGIASGIDAGQFANPVEPEYTVLVCRSRCRAVRLTWKLRAARRLSRRKEGIRQNGKH